MVNVVLWLVFIFLLVLIVSPWDLLPGPLDDLLYALFDMVIVAVLHERKKRKTKRETLPERKAEREPAGTAEEAPADKEL